MVINDFLRGKIPWYLPDPAWPERRPNEKSEIFEGRSGRLGEMPQNEVNNEVASDAESWNGVGGEDESDDSEEEASEEDIEEDEDDIEEEEEDERIQDPRPPKKARR